MAEENHQIVAGGKRAITQGTQKQHNYSKYINVK